MSTRAASARQSAAAPARQSTTAPAPRRAPAPGRTAAPRPRTRTQVRAPRARPRLGLLVVPLLALVLGGIVWVNVAKLALTTQTAAVSERARAVEAESAQLQARLARQQARVMTLARARGMQLSTADTLTFLQSVGGP